jgi:hypothetical protein
MSTVKVFVLIAGQVHVQDTKAAPIFLGYFRPSRPIGFTDMTQRGENKNKKRFAKTKTRD